MLIKCEKCDAMFNVDDTLIDKQEQEFQCSACGNTWLWHGEKHPMAKKTKATNQPEQPVKKTEKTTPEQPTIVEKISIIEETEFIPVADAPVTIPDEFKPVASELEQPRKSLKSLWFFVILLILILMAFIAVTLTPATTLTSLVKSAFQSKPAAIIPAPKPTESLPELEVVDTSFKIVPGTDGNLRLLVQGALLNPASQAQHTHSFWVVLLDENDTVIHEHEVVPLQNRIGPNASQPFYTEITPVPDNIKRMDIVFKE